MAIWNLGSVNADMVYRLPHLPRPGETLTALGFQRGLGGKGANMSVAAVRAGCPVFHIGAVGADGLWMRDRLRDYGADVTHLREVSGPSGHAIVSLDPAGENQILIVPAANLVVDADFAGILGGATPGDIALIQNETNGQGEFAQAARGAGLRVIYAAAPFDVAAVLAVLGEIDMLVLNAVEARQLSNALGIAPEDLDIPDVVITLGGEGCRWINRAQGIDRVFEAPKVQPVDTTGAGDTFTGFLAAGLDGGVDMVAAIEAAQRAAAVMVTRLGTADVIPTSVEVTAVFADLD